MAGASLKMTEPTTTDLSPDAKRALLASMLRRVADAGVRPPLSTVQRRLWFFDQLEPGTWFYNVPAALLFEGPLDVAALERSLAEVVRRHESLRTTFVAGEDEPYQSVGAIAPFTLPVVRLADGAADLDAEIARRSAEETLRPFDLAAGPLFRAQLLRVSAERHVLLATAHHIVCDGLSVKVLIAEVSALYAAFASGRPSPLTELPLQYSDLAAGEREMQRAPSVREHLDYWKAALAGARPALELPIDRVRPAAQTFRGDRQFGRIPAASAERLKAVGREHGATLFMTLLAAFCTLLCRYTDQTDIVIGTPVAGRNVPEAEQMIGCFVNMVPLRCDLSGDPSFATLVRRVRETALRAYEHQAVPFDRVVEELNPVRDPARAPVFQVVLNMSSYADLWSTPAPGLRVRMLDLQHEPSMVDLTLYATELDGAIVLRAVYKSDLFEAATVEQMLRRLETLVDAAAANPGSVLSALPLVGSAERSALANVFSADLEEV